MIGLWVTLCLLATVAESPALNARDWIQHHAADNDADTHHVERVVIAIGSVV